MKIIVVVPVIIAAMVSSASIQAQECVVPEFGQAVNQSELIAHEFDLKLLALLQKNRDAKEESEDQLYN